MSFRAWQNAGKPRDGPIHEEMTRHRLRYRKAIKDKERESSLEISNDLHECLMRKDFKNFWDGLKNKCRTQSSKNFAIEGLTDEDEIACEFATYFEKHCNLVQTEKTIELEKHFQGIFREYETISRFNGMNGLYQH